MDSSAENGMYDRQYRRSKAEAVRTKDADLSVVICFLLRNTAPCYPARSAATMDAYTDELMRRGMCAEVLNVFGPAKSA